MNYFFVVFFISIFLFICFLLLPAFTIADCYMLSCKMYVFITCIIALLKETLPDYAGLASVDLEPDRP